MLSLSKVEGADWQLVKFSFSLHASKVSFCKQSEIKIYLLNGQPVLVTNYGTLSHYFAVVFSVHACNDTS